MFTNFFGSGQPTFGVIGIGSSGASIGCALNDQSHNRRVDGDERQSDPQRMVSFLPLREPEEST